MVKHGEKRELWLIATWASNSISRCYPFACWSGLAHCAIGLYADRPSHRHLLTQVLKQSSSLAIRQLPTVSCAGKVPSECERSKSMVMEQCCSGLGKQLCPGHNRFTQLRKQEELWPMAGSLPMVVIAFRCAFRRLTELLRPRAQVCTFQASSLTAKPTGAQQMCNLLSWLDSNPIHQTTRLLRARP